MDFKLFTDSETADAKTIIPKSTSMEGGTLKTKGGAIIDAEELSGVTLVSTDNSMIQLSALSDLKKCIISCHDIVIRGRFSGEITAKGKVEIGASAVVIGTIKHVGDLLVSGLSDSADLKTIKIAAPTTVSTLPAATPAHTHVMPVATAGPGAQTHTRSPYFAEALTN